MTAVVAFSAAIRHLSLRARRLRPKQSHSAGLEIAFLSLCSGQAVASLLRNDDFTVALFCDGADLQNLGVVV